MFVGRTYVPMNNTYADGGGGGSIDLTSLSSIFFVICLGLLVIAIVAMCIGMVAMEVRRFRKFEDSAFLVFILSVGGCCLFMVLGILASILGY